MIILELDQHMNFFFDVPFVPVTNRIHDRLFHRHMDPEGILIGPLRSVQLIQEHFDDLRTIVGSLAIR